MRRGNGKGQRQRKEDEPQPEPSNSRRKSSRLSGTAETELLLLELGLPTKRRKQREVEMKREESAVVGAEASTSTVNLNMEGSNQAGEGCKMTPEAFQEILDLRKTARKQKAVGKREELQKLRQGDKSTLVWDTLLPQIMDKMKEKASRRGNQVEYARQPEKDLKQLMTLRLVSKNLRSSVDNWFENHLLRMMRDSESSDRLYTVHLKLTDDTEELKRILVFSKGPRKADMFFTRSLQILISPLSLVPGGDEKEDKKQFQKLLSAFRKNIIELLKSVGDQLLHFNLEFDPFEDLVEIGVGVSQVYDILRQSLALMPKLKWLCLSVKGLNDLLPNPRREWDKSLKKALENKPLPRMNELERIDLWAHKKIPIWNPVLETNPHIKFVKQFGPGRWGGEEEEITNYTDPLVLSLALERVNMGKLKFPMLQKIKEGNWNLKKITLEIEDDSNPIDAVFQCLQNFQTLEDLSLQFGDITIGNELNFLRLPNLRNFCIEFGPTVKGGDTSASDFFHSLQFLIYCGKLEEFTWENGMNSSFSLRRRMEGLGEREGIMIDFKSGLMDLCGSTVWDVFPQLKYIKVQYNEGTTPKERKKVVREYRDRKLVSQTRRKADSKSYGHSHGHVSLMGRCQCLQLHRF